MTVVDPNFYTFLSFKKNDIYMSFTIKVYDNKLRENFKFPFLSIIDFIEGLRFLSVIHG